MERDWVKALSSEASKRKRSTVVEERQQDETTHCRHSSRFENRIRARLGYPGFTRIGSFTQLPQARFGQFRDIDLYRSSGPDRAERLASETAHHGTRCRGCGRGIAQGGDRA
jgi:hypothetical protein